MTCRRGGRFPGDREFPVQFRHLVGRAKKRVFFFAGSKIFFIGRWLIVSLFLYGRTKRILRTTTAVGSFLFFYYYHYYYYQIQINTYLLKIDETHYEYMKFHRNLFSQISEFLHNLATRHMLTAVVFLGVYRMFAQSGNT